MLSRSKLKKLVVLFLSLCAITLFSVTYLSAKGGGRGGDGADNGAGLAVGQNGQNNIIQASTNQGGKGKVGNGDNGGGQGGNGGGQGGNGGGQGGNGGGQGGNGGGQGGNGG